MQERGALAKEARRLAAEHGMSLRQAYRYAATGRRPSEIVRVGSDGRRYRVHLAEGHYDELQVQRIRYTVAGVAKRAGAHGITKNDLEELETAIVRINDLAAIWRDAIAVDNSQL